MKTIPPPRGTFAERHPLIHRFLHLQWDRWTIGTTLLMLFAIFALLRWPIVQSTVQWAYALLMWLFAGGV